MKWLVFAAVLGACGSDAVKIDEGVRIEYSIEADAARDPRTAVQDAVRVMRSRIERGHIKATVASRGDTIIVDLDAGTAEGVDRAKTILARSGYLEAHLVDDGSAVMREVYTHVSQDPDTTSRGIAADREQWAAPDGTRHEDAFLRARERRELERYVSALAASDPQFRLPDDHKIIYERIDDPQTPSYRDRSSWRTYYAERTLRLKPEDISDARTSLERATLRPTVRIDLRDDAAEKLATFTTSIVGRKLAVLLDDRVIMAPIIMGRLDRITLPTPDAADLAIVLASGPLPAPVREERVSGIRGDKLIMLDEQGREVTVPRS